MDEILVALDLTEHSGPVLATAVRLARALDARLVLLHVEAPDPEFVGFDAGPQPVRDSVARELRTDHQALQEEAARLEAAGVEATPLLVQGPTARTIVEQAVRLDSDLIVMGSHSKGPLARMLLGSVSHEVLRAAGRPVLVVPSPPGG